MEPTLSVFRELKKDKLNQKLMVARYYAYPPKLHVRESTRK